ncbi:MAG TPA: hypothetical protein GXZ59_01315 [Clostridiaceae bacterium]|nr:hypothetical protein [Clostridiaceae bacterium]
MALKEGRCINCGSLLILDPRMEKGQCLFCGAVFINDEAIAAMDLPNDHEFPNEEQPEYTGPSLAVQPSREVVYAPPVTPRARKGKKVEVFELKDPEIPDLKIPKKKIILISSVVAGIFIIFLAVFFLFSLDRDSKREKISNQFVDSLPYELVSESGIAIDNMSNNDVTLILKESVTDQEAAVIFLDYANVRAEVMGYDDSDFSATVETVSMRLATPTGGFLIKQPESPEDLVLGKAMIKLD